MDYTIIVPSKPSVVKETGNLGVYEIEGLYAGYGHTLGNSLRRIILSSIPGAAITAVKIDGTSHEFSKIPGIKEDVITILLNLKKVRLKMNTDDKQVLEIDVKGQKDVSAGDIKASGQVEIMNPDQHIAKLTAKDSKLKIEITIEKGLGYMSREDLHKNKVDVGSIVLDAIFTPVKKVSYEVENMRVGDRTDYNRLRFAIETDGSITPKEALEKSIETMIKQLKAIIGFKEEIIIPKKAMMPTEDEDESDIEDKSDDIGSKEILKTRVEDLELSSRTVNALTGAGIRTIGGLVRKKESDLLEIEGIGAKVVQEIRDALGGLGQALKE
ncbi:TPA: DNA-directed RNA polymerase subunit alpha [Patescibacteria group bacterium]|nr:MAG: DNA-directed RNA polymerase subunit alpha [Parcubacteria group bacterium GW2011_GWF2_40_10]KKR46788.1 MAG: DNA-directed RNA polymerase subunit alpha [Parcubacteria group bacterium GW2011_GWA2_40_143]KKR59692.1 MAG: DNA-directed RNA polymerase subunit alpha [Parcubacteria group bacterium GW2011_GWC2_40_31]KKR74585.1 MAG: DNA-directed RNA polymerase subunit alpha [Parcubacteria group bacterium GW2011_GWB2_40_8]KKR75811.1 MAG: DNA-directed RNA polymerase subunit alpha [Parcubacteria group 